nr:protein rapunzel-like [Misgurnus anguillicaudatus]XP_055067228.1 protein rapunzel-like [Misgurnus anguillicaudatus]XP_055067229.1 protein rapunzel-like [Misgurnus anguillicaudatus]XP_055067230.1 protein rapunzel-like [Misgurnus anguillicaudatus]
MANIEEIRVTAVKVLRYIEKVSSFAASINPLFGIVTSVVGVIRKGLVAENDHELSKDFKQIHEKLETISEKNKQTLRRIRIHEVNETFDKYEEYIKHQYRAFNTMVDSVKLDPDNSEKHMEDFVKIYERFKSDMSLDVYYRGVMGTGALFGRPLLKVYLDECERDRGVMEARCSHIAHLFYIGLMTLMAYTSVKEDDEDKVRYKWEQRVVDIQAKMQEALDQCEQGN